MSDEHRAEAALQRSLAALTIGTPVAHEEREDALYPLRAVDMAQHLHCDIQGQAWRKPTWGDLTVTFPYPFIMAADPARGDGNLDTPTFTHGVELQSQLDPLIFVYLTGWTRDERDFHTGATLRVGAWLPEAPKRLPFAGRLHLQFNGYAAPAEDDSEG